MIVLALALAAATPTATVDAFHAALDRGDARAASALLADDVLIYESGEVEHGRADYAAHHLGSDIAFSAAVKSTVTKRSIKESGMIASVASEGRTRGTWHSKPIDLTTTETMVLQRVARGWRIVQIHWSSAKAR